MNEFKSYHPVVVFAYFAAVIGMSMFVMHPICMTISFASGFAYSIMLGGRKSLKFNLVCLIPMIIITALINPAFNHKGITIIGYLPTGNPLTAEAIAYGIAAAVMLVSVICHFSCFNKLMTSDKFMYLFGKLMPALSLLLSMALRFIPKFKTQIKAVSDAQKCVGKDAAEGNIIKRAKNGVKILSIMLTWSLENAIDTADSMKSRGYGLPHRTAFSNFKLDSRDITALAVILALVVYILLGAARGGLYFRYFPSLKGAELTAYGMSVMTVYALLFMLPVIIEIKEGLRWKKLKSRI